MKKRKKFLLAAISIAIILLGMFAVMVYKEAQYQKRTYSVLAQLMQDKVELKDIDYNSLGKYGDSVKIFSEAYTKFNTDMKNIDSEASQYENINFFEKKYMDNPTEGKENSKHFFDLIPKLEAALTQDQEQVNISFEKIPLPQKPKDEIYKIMNDTKTKLLNETKPLEESLKTLNSKTDALYDFLISRKGKYTSEANNISFNSQQDVDKYKELVTAIKTAAQDVK
jgi:hypothetical protein